MKVEVIERGEITPALLGLGLSHGKTSGVSYGEFFYGGEGDDLLLQMSKVAQRLKGKGGGHDKFLRMITYTLDITAPLYWWKQFDTYKIGTVSQSESTMHTLMKTPFTPDMFEGDVINEECCIYLNEFRERKDFDNLNKVLPQSFLQRRIIMTNAAVLRNMVDQRHHHKLPEWKLFCDVVSQEEWVS